jgi:predicted dehydrogenase
MTNSNHDPENKKIWRGGMVGAGAWSEPQLLAWAGVKNARIVALADRHPERRRPVAGRFGIRQEFDDAEAMLDQVDLDFVDICTRPYSHAPLTRLAAERGMPVLCQKPFCESLKQAHDVVDFCAEQGVRLMINENFRWQAWYRRAKAVIESGALGVPFFARLHRLSCLTSPRLDERQAYFADMPRLIVYEMGVHYLDTFRYLFGEPTWLFAHTQHISPHVRGEDVQLLTLGYPGMTALIQESWALVAVPGLDQLAEKTGPVVPPPRFEIEGTTGTLVLRADGWMQVWGNHGQQAWYFSDTTRAASRAAAQQHFIDCLETGAPFETSGAETLRTMALVFACYASAEENCVVRL